MDRSQNQFITLRASVRLSAMLLATIAGSRLAIAQPSDQPTIDPPSSTGLESMAGQQPEAPPEPSGAHAVSGGSHSAPTNAEAALAAGKFKDAMKGNAKKQGLDIKVDANQLVDLAVKDEDLAAVLEMLSLQSQKNIIASKDVSAKVTANFFGVTFYQAMDAILHANGFGYIEKDNFIYVYTAEQLAAIIEAGKVRMTKVINLNYINPVDAAEFVKAALSEGGQITTPGKTVAFPTSKDVPGGGNDYVGRDLIVVTDFEENIAAVEELIKRLDERPVQVEIQATIVQANLSEMNAFGVDISLLANLDFADITDIGGPGRAADALGVNNQDKLTSPGASDLPFVPRGGSGAAANSSPGNFAGPGTFKIGFIKNDVAMFLRVLDQVTDTTVLSNPRILVLNRMASRVLVGRRVGYLNTTSTDTATTQTVEFLDTGTQLHVRPFVSDDGVIRLELKPQVSEAIVRDVRNSSGSVVTVPDEITNELTTNVIVRDGQTVVLGGLFRDKTQTTRRQVPFLGDIPILGEAFKGTDNEVERTEIIFLVTPKVVNDTALAAAGLRGIEKVDQIRAGSRENLLAFSRDKRSSQLLVEAQQLADAGDTQKALFKLQQSLAMNPVQTDALALKEKLTGQKTYWPSRSMLDDIIRREQGLPKAEATPISPSTTTSASTSGTDTTTNNVTTDATTNVTTPVSSTVEPAATTTTAAVTENTSTEHAGTTGSEVSNPSSENVTPVPSTTDNAGGSSTDTANSFSTNLADPMVIPVVEHTIEQPVVEPVTEIPDFTATNMSDPAQPQLTPEQQQERFRVAMRILFKYLTGATVFDNSDVSTFAQIPEGDANADLNVEATSK
jgi:type IV pilus assembly protein PilQ